MIPFRQHKKNINYVPPRAMITMLLLLGCSTLCPVNAYDIGCLYPEEMGQPFLARAEMGSIIHDDYFERGMEEPVIIYNAFLQINHCQTNCLAFHNDASLNTFTKARPMFPVPAEYHNAWATMLCASQCIVMVDSYSKEEISSKWNIDFQPTNEELMACNLDPNCSKTIAEEADYHPFTIGQVVYFEIESKLRDDGWNSLGQDKYDAVAEEIVECSANCVPYTDTIGYFPQNYPGYKNPNSGKYDVKGKHKKWQPLLESTGSGNLVRQQHVTPHIGFHVQPIVLNFFKRAKQPTFDYKAEADLVVMRLGDLVGDAERASLVEEFDTTLGPHVTIHLSLRKNYQAVLTFQDYILFLSGLFTAEHDALIQAWREKVRWDRVRPTTVIQRWNDDIINTYNGNPKSKNPTDIYARDFQAYMRVKPNSEYPSATASLCTAWAEYTDAYTQEYYGENLNLTVDMVQGVNLHNMTEFSKVCGESRVWGGMSFTPSVEEGHRIAKGIGQLALDLVKELKNGSTWNGNGYIKDDPRPVCGE